MTGLNLNHSILFNDMSMSYTEFYENYYLFIVFVLLYSIQDRLALLWIVIQFPLFFVLVLPIYVTVNYHSCYKIDVFAMILCLRAHSINIQYNTIPFMITLMNIRSITLASCPGHSYPEAE